MHRIALCLILLAATAHADDDRAADAAFAAAPGRALAAGIMGRVSHVGGHSESGAAGDLEYALGSGHWQYFGEALFGAANLDQMTAAPPGYIARGGVGVRWLARQFQPDRGGGVELYLEAIAGVERYWWQDGGRLTRPDLGFGTGMQVRAWAFHGLTLRTGARVVFTPTDRDAALVACRGSGCPVGTSTGIAGLMVAFMVGW